MMESVVKLGNNQDKQRYKVHTITTLEEQKQRLIKEEAICQQRIYEDANITREGLFCDRVWDNIMCWDATPAGTVAKQKCASYIDGFQKSAYVERTCTENGTWYINPFTNATWSDYSKCAAKTNGFREMSEHLPRIRLMYNIGYGISLCSLIIAVFLMLCCRRLHSKSNTLHINLFLAFILRAFMSFLKDSLFVQGLALEKDVVRHGDKLTFKEGGTHWECKLLYTMFVYGVSVSCMWIFMEALYLHMLVYRTLFTERNGVKMYIFLGWLGPFAFIIPWVVVRIVEEDVLCWNTNPTPEYMWIITGSLLLTTVINFIFFIDIIRVLFLRVKTNRNVSGARKIRKLAKFIAVLIPLFGVTYIVFSVLYRVELDEEMDIPYLYCEMFYNSFQGFWLALLFCFLNEEVQLEIKKFWYKYALNRHDSYVYTRTAFLSSWRGTSHNSRIVSQCDTPSETSVNGRLLRSPKNNNYGQSHSFHASGNKFRPSGGMYQNSLRKKEEERHISSKYLCLPQNGPEKQENIELQ